MHEYTRVYVYIYMPQSLSALEASRSPESVVISSCKLPDVEYWEPKLNMDPLQGVLITTGALFIPNSSTFIFQS